MSFVPNSLKIGHNGEFIIMANGNQMAVVDMEANDVVEWAIEGEQYGWLVNDMLYTVTDGNLIVYDYDGLNRRELAKNVSNHFPVTITENKWLYYFSDDYIMREWLISR